MQQTKKEVVKASSLQPIPALPATISAGCTSLASTAVPPPGAYLVDEVASSASADMVDRNGFRVPPFPL